MHNPSSVQGKIQDAAALTDRASGSQARGTGSSQGFASGSPARSQGRGLLVTCRVAVGWVGCCDCMEPALSHPWGILWMVTHLKCLCLPGLGPSAQKEWEEGFPGVTALRESYSLSRSSKLVVLASLSQEEPFGEDERYDPSPEKMHTHAFPEPHL